MYRCSRQGFHRSVCFLSRASQLCKAGGLVQWLLVHLLLAMGFWPGSTNCDSIDRNAVVSPVNEDWIVSSTS